MRLRKAKVEALQRGTPVKWPGCGHQGWWRVERVDSQFVRIERGGVSQYVPARVLRVEAA
jgi:hypothetical protein